MARDGMDVRQGTVDLLVLKALTWGPMHGYAILAALRRATDGELRLEDAALYPALHRLEARELVEAEWGLSENNRRARYYRLTSRGRQALRKEAESWTRYVGLVARVLGAVEQPA
ncbi:MAG TPA: PadR family transcriptional regulator [Gemmatimonadaceae bacterium]|nr:PadR family transcriptional regulator [Gemmatimonadaceae bacterium]